MLQVGDRVVVRDPDKEVKGELLSEETINLLEALNYTGVVTKDEGSIYFVGFAHETLGWVTQGFREEELEKVD